MEATGPTDPFGTYHHHGYEPSSKYRPQQMEMGVVKVPDPFSGKLFKKSYNFPFIRRFFPLRRVSKSQNLTKSRAHQGVDADQCRNGWKVF